MEGTIPKLVFTVNMFFKLGSSTGYKKTRGISGRESRVHIFQNRTD